MLFLEPGEISAFVAPRGSGRCDFMFAKQFSCKYERFINTLGDGKVAPPDRN